MKKDKKDVVPNYWDAIQEDDNKLNEANDVRKKLY